MDVPPFKKQKFNPPLSENEVTNSSGFIWDDDFIIHEEELQMIETQALSQLQRQASQQATIPTIIQEEPVPAVTKSSTATDSSSSISYQGLSQQVTDDHNEKHRKILEELQMKKGEVSNLRIEIEEREKDHRHQLKERDKIIEDLKKKLSGKQSEMEFQKMEMLSHSMVKPTKQSVNLNTSSQNLKPNSSKNFRDRFSFDAHSKPPESEPFVCTENVFDFHPNLHKGDILYEILRTTLLAVTETKSCKFPDFMKVCLLELCRFKCFEELEAKNIIKLIFKQCYDLLQAFLKKLSNRDSKLSSPKNRKIKLEKFNIRPSAVEKKSLLLNTKWSENEKGTEIRQAVAVVSYILGLDPALIKFIVKFRGLTKNRCDCFGKEQENSSASATNELKSESGTESCSSEEDTGELFDFGPLLSSIINRIIVNDLQNVINATILIFLINQEISSVGGINITEFDSLCLNKSSHYDGLFSSIVYFYQVLWNCPNVVDRYICPLKEFREIVFSLAGPTVIVYVMDFLSSTSSYKFSESLCHRSGAHTFSEDYKFYSFTADTCILQVICGQIDLMCKSPRLVDMFTRWVSEVSTLPHNRSWLHNKTDEKFCECLPTLEQLSIKIMLFSVMQLTDAKANVEDKSVFKTSLRRCCYILKQFRCHDVQFNDHIINCKGEYKILLLSLSKLFSDRFTQNFVTAELRRLNELYDLTEKLKTEIISSMSNLSIFSDDGKKHSSCDL